MKVGIVGFAGCGKTTVFNALTGLSADTGYGAKDKANLGMIRVPDPRVDFLTRIHQPKKVTLAEIAFIDVAGPEGKESRGGLDRRVVDAMRGVDALVQVVRAFDNPALDKPTDAERDFADFNSELVLADLIQVENRLTRLAKEHSKATQEIVLMERLRAQLDGGGLLAALELTEPELQSVAGYRFLTQQPMLVLFNCAAAQVAAGVPAGPAAAAAALKLPVLAMAAQAEAEIAELGPDDQKDFLADLGIKEPARDRFIRAVYEQLDLISFLTMGEDECRAWTITRGTDARRAGGKIHSDIERGFIRAEVIAYDDFAALQSEAKCREAGKLRLEGKEYVVQDGDIVNFRFNV